MPDTLEAVSQFVSAVHNYPDVWRSFEVRALAARFGGEWHGIAGHIRLHKAGPDATSLHGDMTEVPGLLVSRTILPLSELARVLGGIARGALDIEGACVKFSSTGERQGRRPFYASMDVSPAEVSHPDVDRPFDTGFFLSLIGDSAKEVLGELGGPERVDRLLRVAAKPYKDVSTFLHNALHAQGGTAS